MTAARHRNTAYLSALILLSVALWMPRLEGPLDFRYDAGVYYILGTSLAEGKGYRLLNEPGEIEAIQYPPLLPLVAAVHQRLAGSVNPNVVGPWLRYSFAVLVTGYIAAVYLLARRYLVPGFAFLTALVSLLNVYTTWLSDLFFAEIPFVLLSLLFLLVVGRGGRGGSQRWLAGALGGACYLLRSVGIVLLAAWVGASLLRRRYKEMVFRAALALVPVIVWQGYILHVKSSAEYAEPAYPYQRAAYQFYNVGYLENLTYLDSFVPELGKVTPGLLATRIARNLASMPESWGEAVSVRTEWPIRGIEWVNRELSPPVAVPIWPVHLALNLLGAVVFAGLALLLLRGEWFIPLYVAGSVTLISLTPWPGQFERYLAPLTPLFALALFVALVAARERLTALASRRWRSAGTALIAVFAIGILGQEAVALFLMHRLLHTPALYEDGSGNEREYRLFFYTQPWRLHDAALDWLKREAKSGEIVATSTPHWTYLRTGLRAIMPPFEPRAREAQRLLDSVPASYLIVDNIEAPDISRRYAAPVVRAFPDRWALIYSTPGDGSRIYRRVTPGGSTGPP